MRDAKNEILSLFTFNIQWKAKDGEKDEEKDEEKGCKTRGCTNIADVRQFSLFKIGPSE